VEIVGEAADGEAGLSLLAEHAPDLAFVDVQMPGLDGLQMVARIPAPAPYVIFTTAHDRYAIEAFEAGAIDYLLKPFDGARLVRAVPAPSPSGCARGPRRCSPRSGSRAAGPRILSDRLPIASTAACCSCPSPTSPTASSSTSWSPCTPPAAPTPPTTPSSRSRQRLDPARFFRAHRTLLVNLDHVAAIDDMAGGRSALVTHAGDKLAVSRQSSRRLRALLGL
jgi:two-component system LytT family response regulator